MDKLDMIYNDVKHIKTRIDDHLDDHKGVDLHKLQRDVEKNRSIIIYATGIAATVAIMITYLKEAILSWIGTK